MCDATVEPGWNYCEKHARERQEIASTDVGDVSSVLGSIIEVAVDVFSSSTSDDTASTGSDWSSPDSDSGSGFGGGGASGDF